MVAVPEVSEIVEFVALESVRMNVSFGSTVRSPQIVTGTLTVNDAVFEYSAEAFEMVPLAGAM